MTKAELKSIIKECIIEVLADGLGQQLTEAVKKPVTRQAHQQQQPLRTRQELEAKAAATHANFQAIAKANSGGNKVLEAILLDTAKTSLQEQLKHPDPQSSLEQLTSQQPSNVVVDGESIWSQIAFG